jgi:hypothetical protein
MWICPLWEACLENGGPGSLTGRESGAHQLLGASRLRDHTLPPVLRQSTDRFVRTGNLLYPAGPSQPLQATCRQTPAPGWLKHRPARRASPWLQPGGEALALALLVLYHQHLCTQQNARSGPSGTGRAMTRYTVVVGRWPRDRYGPATSFCAVPRIPAGQNPGTARPARGQESGLKPYARPIRSSQSTTPCHGPNLV